MFYKVDDLPTVMIPLKPSEGSRRTMTVKIGKNDTTGTECAGQERYKS